MVDSNTTSWQPLPPRKKKIKHIQPIEVDEMPNTINILTDCNPFPLVLESERIVEGSSAELHHQEISENIQARSVLKRVNATLDSKDGCAGEFYECSYSIDVGDCVQRTVHVHIEIVPSVKPLYSCYNPHCYVLFYFSRFRPYC